MESTPERHSFHLRFRLATQADVPALASLIEASVRRLQAGDYSASQIEGALGSLLGVDSQLIADGTYFIASAAAPFIASAGAPDGASTPETMVGCGGWSRRKTLCGSDHAYGREDAFLDPRRDAAKIRAIFVHPEWARRGIGSRILEVCEQAAAEAGFSRLEMGSTLTGVPLYRLKGYVEVERLAMPMPGGETLPVVRMTKELASRE